MVGFRYACEAIDYLVGPVEPGVLVEFYGYSQTGKTTLSAYLPILEISRQNELPKNGIFIVFDGDEGFSHTRLKQILFENGFSEEKVEDVINRLWLFKPVEFREQHDLAQELRKKLKENKKVPILISADAITAVYRGIVLRSSMQHRAKTIGIYQGKLDLQLNEMRRLAVRNECPFLVTTWRQSPLGMALGANEPEFDGIGGRLFYFFPKIIVRLDQPKRGNSERLAILVKHRDKKEGLSRRFRMVDSGIEGAEDDLENN